MAEAEDAFPRGSVGSGLTGRAERRRCPASPCAQPARGLKSCSSAACWTGHKPPGSAGHPHMVIGLPEGRRHGPIRYRAPRRSRPGTDRAWAGRVGIARPGRIFQPTRACAPDKRNPAPRDTVGYGEDLVDECRLALDGLLPFNDSERTFLDLLLDEGKIDASLLTAVEMLQERIEAQPLLEWKAQNVLRHRRMR